MESPCIDVCTLDPVTGLCEGCARSIEEITRWASYTPAERRRIMAELDGRKASLCAR